MKPACLKVAKVDEENARRDEEQRSAQSRIASLEMLVSYLRNTDPGVAEFMAAQPPVTAAATTGATQPPATAAANTANATANPPANAPATSLMSNTTSSSPST